MKTAIIFSALLLLSSLAEDSAAQIGLQPGARVRVSVQQNLAVPGRLISLGSDTILFSAFGSNEVQSVPIAYLRSLQRSLGGNADQTALRGALLGAVVGALAINVAKGPMRMPDLAGRWVWVREGLCWER